MNEREELIALRRLAELEAKAANTPAPKLSKAEGALRTLAQGASFGFGDEIAGAVSAATGGDYKSGRADYLAGQQEYEDASPKTAFALELGGGLMTGLGGATKAAAVLPVKAAAAIAKLPQWAKVAGAGAAAGGIAGAGYADPGERTKGAAIGGAVGGATALAMPPVVKAVGKGVSKVAGGVGKALSFAGGKPEGRARELIGRALKRDEVTHDMLNQRLAELGPEATIADAAGENMLGLAETAASIPGKAKNQAGKVLEARAKSAQIRIVRDLLGTVGVDDVNFDGAVGKLHQNMRDVAAKHGYDEILNSGQVQMTPELEKLMTGRTMKQAMGQAFAILDDDISLGRADKKLQEYFRPDPDGEMFMPFGGQTGDIASRPTLRVWDYVKRGLDSIVRDNTDPVTGKMTPKGERTAEIRRQFMKQVDDGNADYKAVRAAYADEMSAESSMRLGRAFLREDAEVTARRMADLSDSEKQFFRLGAARALYDKVQASIETGQSWRKLAKSPLIRDKIKEIFPSEAEAEKFLFRIEKESVFGRTRNQITGNSATARRLAGQEDVGVQEEMVDALTRGSLKGTAASLVRSLFKNAATLPEPVRNELSDALFTQDPATRNALLQNLSRKLNAPPTNWLATPAQAFAVGQQSTSARK